MKIIGEVESLRIEGQSKWYLATDGDTVCYALFLEKVNQMVVWSVEQFRQVYNDLEKVRMSGNFRPVEDDWIIPFPRRDDL